MTEYTPVNLARDLAKILYTSHNKTIQDICVDTNSDEATVRGWIQKYGWEAHRRTLTATKQAQLEILYDILAEQTAKVKSALADTKTKKAEITTKDVDLILKYTVAIKNLEKDTSVREIIDTGKAFIAWLSTKDLPLSQKLIVLFDELIAEKLGNPVSKN